MRIYSALLLIASTPLVAQVELHPNQDIAAIVASSPEGTTFKLHAGTYRMVSLAPRANDRFEGVDGPVIFDGAEILTGFTLDTETGLWTAPIDASAPPSGTCEPSKPLCGFTQDVFIDNALQTPVSGVREVAGGSYYFDHDGLRLYLPMAVNPNHRLVEMAKTPVAFKATAPGVRITGTEQNPFIVEMYASPAQFGAIGGAPGGRGWIIDGVEVRFNHGAGIKAGPGAQILNCFLHHNGQLGFSWYGPDGSAEAGGRVAHNDISNNNTAGFSMGWEAGGGKFWKSTGVQVEHNKVHDNDGHGLWFDTCNIGETIASNNVTGNSGSGLFLEVSGEFTVTGNTFANNESNELTDPWNAQIQVYASPQGTISGNTIVVPHATTQQGRNAGLGIVLLAQGRRTVSCGAFTTGAVTDVVVSGNTITYDGTGWTGMAFNDGEADNMFNGVHFDENRYIDLAEHGSSCTDALWSLPQRVPERHYYGLPATFKEWQAAGFDRGGSCTGQ